MPSWICQWNVLSKKNLHISMTIIIIFNRRRSLYKEIQQSHLRHFKNHDARSLICFPWTFNKTGSRREVEVSIVVVVALLKMYMHIIIFEHETPRLDPLHHYHIDNGYLRHSRWCTRVGKRVDGGDFNTYPHFILFINLPKAFGKF